MPQIQPFIDETLAVNRDAYLHTEYGKESKLANLFTDLSYNASTKNKQHVDFVVLNSGGFRTEWLPGNITDLNLYNMLPFNNKLVSFVINGSALLKTIEILQEGDAALYHFHGVQTTVSRKPDGHFELLSAKMMTGEKGDSLEDIQPSRNYIGVTVDFLLKGGDDFGKVIEQKVYEPTGEIELGLFRELVRKEIKNTTII